jgi:hypothetical protein
MPYCPNCDQRVAYLASICPSCGALFGPGSAWQPVAKPPRRPRRPPPKPRCAKCRAEVTFDVAKCPHCGFVFGPVASTPAPAPAPETPPLDPPPPPRLDVRMKHVWQWFVGLHVFELVAALWLAESALARHPLVVKLVRAIDGIAPAVGNFDSASHDVAAVRFFLALTLCLLPYKVLFWFLWLNSDRWANYRHFVVSPLTHDRPTTGDFVQAPVAAERTDAPRRSMLNRVVWSLLTLGMSAMGWWLVFDYGFEVRDSIDTLRRIERRQQAIMAGGFAMWLNWSVFLLNFSAALLAVGICVLRDYFYFFRWLVRPRRPSAR